MAEHSILALDTGAGNGLLDHFVKMRTHTQEKMDTDGHYGLQGQVNEELLRLLFAESIKVNGTNYFDLIPPKSLDINDMHLPEAFKECSLEDGCATLAAFTAEALVRSIAYHYDQTQCLPTELILAGGGWYNKKIYQELNARLQQAFPDKTITLKTATEIGWNVDSLEAEIFAYLGLRALQKKPLSYTNLTGTKSESAQGDYQVGRRLCLKENQYLNILKIY